MSEDLVLLESSAALHRRRIAPHIDRWHEPAFMTATSEQGRRGRPALRRHAGGIRRSAAASRIEAVINRELSLAGFDTFARRCTRASSRLTFCITHRGAEAALVAKLATGEMVGAIAMTEPHRSDLQGVRTSAKSRATATCSTAPRPLSPMAARQPDHRRCQDRSRSAPRHS